MEFGDVLGALDQSIAVELELRGLEFAGWRMSDRSTRPAPNPLRSQLTRACPRWGGGSNRSSTAGSAPTSVTTRNGGGHGAEVRCLRHRLRLRLRLTRPP